MKYKVVIKNEQLYYEQDVKKVYCGGMVRLHVRDLERILNDLSPTEGGWTVGIRGEDEGMDIGKRKVFRPIQTLIF